MSTPSLLDKKLGMDIYTTKENGFKGFLKENPDDFRVLEVLFKYGKAFPRNQSLHGRGNHLLCVVSKREWDNLLLVDTIAKKLNISTHSVGLAGLKDKKAFTTQYISFKKGNLHKVTNLRIKNVTIHPIGFICNRLSSKLLLGNYFDISLRIIDNKKDIKNSILSNIKEIRKIHGFLNYYGYQRFGSIRPVTHLVGRLLVKRKIEEAINTYIGFIGSNEQRDAKEARKAFQEGEDLEDVYRLFPQRLIYERKILERLMKTSNDYVCSFRVLPINLRRLFLNAYQSYLFNKILSLRIKEDLPLNKVVEGDWVLRSHSDEGKTKLITKASKGDLKRLNNLISEGKASLALPIFGYLTQMSDGVEGIIERKILDEEEIMSLKQFYVGALPEIGARGGLRPALSAVKGFNYDFIKEKIRFNFFLYKESYASVFLRDFIKPLDPVAAGF
jgi:tRNA pseudouridine13 synthase